MEMPYGLDMADREETLALILSRSAFLSLPTSRSLLPFHSPPSGPSYGFKIYHSLNIPFVSCLKALLYKFLIMGPGPTEKPPSQILVSVVELCSA